MEHSEAFFGEPPTEETIDPLVSELSLAMMKFENASAEYKKAALKSEWEFIDAYERIRQALPDALFMPYNLDKN